MPDVDPAKSDALITSGGHSGCAITLMPGLAALTSSTSLAVNYSCTIHVPFHEIIFTFVLLAT